MANHQETSTIKQLKNQRRTSTSTEESESVKNVDSGVGVRTLTFIKKEEAEEVEPTDGRVPRVTTRFSVYQLQNKCAVYIWSTLHFTHFTI